MSDPMDRCNTHDSSDEIDIRGIFIILNQQKKIILGVFLTCLFLSVVMMVVTKPVYESKAIIAVGQIGQQGQQIQQPIEDPLLLVQRLQESQQAGDSSAVLSTAEIDNKANNVVVLIANGNKPEETQEFLNNIVTQVVQEHERIYNVAFVAHQQRLVSLEQQIKDVDSAIHTYSDVINTNAKSNDSLPLVMVLEKSKAQSQKLDMEKQVTEEKIAIELQLKPTKVFREATLPVTPIKPKPPIYIGSGVIVGLLLGVMLALVKHNMQGGKRRSTDTN